MMNNHGMPIVAFGHFDADQGPGNPGTLDESVLCRSPKKFIGVTHGLWDPPKLLRPHIHALLLVHESDCASAAEIKLQAVALPETRRIFGLVAGGWTSLSSAKWEKIAAFLASELDVPGDHEVQTALGLDAPVLRLGLRVALEVIRREIVAMAEVGPSQQVEPGTFDTAVLLQPAIELAEGVRDQDQTAESLRSFAAGAKGASLLAVLDDALERLAQNDRG
jgi:hypothetical protein